MSVEIDYLAHHQDSIPMLAAWHHAQWSYLSPNFSLEARTAQLAGQASMGGVPTAFVARSGGEVLGSASLVTNDMRSHPELSPWLASVYVREDRRGEGIGTALVRRVMEEAKSLRVGILYLFTPDRAPFYAKLGWQEMLREEYGGEEQVIMQVRLADA